MFYLPVLPQKTKVDSANRVNISQIMCIFAYLHIRVRIPELKLFSWIGKVNSGIFSVDILSAGMEEFAMTQRIDECDIGILIWVFTRKKLSL